MAMRFGAAFWVQRTGWPELREAVLRAEAAGFDDLWIDDHLLSDEGEWSDPKLEGWTTLAAVAAVTFRARVGHMVSANTLRNPGLTAKMATTIDHVSGGRAILGIGAGWFEREHEAFGFDFGSGFGERLDRLAEAVPLLRRLLDGETVTHEGRFYTFRDAVCAPRPVQARLPILIGGSGPKKTLPLVARYADLWNAYGTPDEVAAADAILRAACEAAGRDEREIERTVNLNVVIRSSRGEAEAAWERWLAAHLPQDDERGLSAGGPLEEVAATLARYRDAGFAHPIMIFRTPFDLETMDRLTELRAMLGG
jgi:F420-dependent oxidoreductase-like protein